MRTRQIRTVPTEAKIHMTFGAWSNGEWSDPPTTATHKDLPSNKLCIDEVHRGPPYESGGPLDIRKAYGTRRLSDSIDLVAGTRRAVGCFVAKTPFGVNVPQQPFEAGGDFGNASMGAKGWNKFRPGNPAEGLGQFLAELRQIPTIPFRLHELARLTSQKRKELLTLKRAGSEYLNVQFGWIPFLRDLRGIVKVARSLRLRLEQLRRDNGQKVRRKGTIMRSTTASTTTSTSVYLDPTLPPQFYAQVNGVRETTDIRSLRHWFSAAFRYWVPDIGSDLWTVRATAALFGVNPTPGLLYDVMPWSWLIDWFSNMGDVIHNMSANAVDNLAADYAYVMTERLTTICYNEKMKLIPPYGWIHASTSLHWETKLRSAASPYGFGLLPSDLSARQMLILSALGISRSW